MTYCVAISVDEGLVFVSDSRTNAGVDQLSTYTKMFSFAWPGERSLVVMTGGNLATTQVVLKKISKDLEQGEEPNLRGIASMDDLAEYVGALSLSQQRKHGNVRGGVDTSASFIIGGQVCGQVPEIYMVYPEGNYIAATAQTPYQQIGETKYGKPILDRIITPQTSLNEAFLCGLVSMDSTMRSNATVGPPIEASIYYRDSLEAPQHVRFERDDPYLIELHAAWQQNLKEAFARLPRFELGATRPQSRIGA